MSDVITSASNPLVKRLRKLTQRRYRREEQAAVVHGIQPVRQAYEAGVGMERLVISDELLKAESARRWVVDQQQQGMAVSRLTAELFTRISEREGPTGLAAIIATTPLPPQPPEVGGPATWLAVERVGNPGNLGTMLRSADASGAAGVWLVGATADLWDPATIKASMGAVFSMPVAQCADMAELRTWAAGADASVVTTAARAPESIWTAAFSPRTVIVMGSEQEGLDDQTLASGDLAVHIPMVGTAESLNVAQAATLLLFEAFRQRSSAADPR